MMKYGLMLSLIVSSTMFGVIPQKEEQAERLQQVTNKAKKDELARADKDLRAASVLLRKHKGHNQAALGASWDELEKIDDIRGDIQDQLQDRENN